MTNINSALSGSSAGVMSSAGSGQPGAAGSIRIRGFGSINASNVPLYVVDGAPYDGDLANLNVNDIQNISILKDASASALYGSRAANGVVIVTTIKGKKGGDQLGVNITQGVSSRGIPEYERVDANQYYPLAWEAYKNNLVFKGESDAAARIKASSSIKGALGYNPFNVADGAIVGTNGLLNPDAKLLYNDFDWTEPLRRVGKRTDANINYSGASEKSDYFMSLGYLDDKGYVQRSDYNRVTGRISLNANPLTWFKTGLNISGNLTKSNRASGQTLNSQGTTATTGYNNLFYFARNIGPIYPVYMHDASGAFITDKNGDKVYDLGDKRPSGASSGRQTRCTRNTFKHRFN
ncbi:TonB-dependent receptor plug domain-containing protein [Pedobacter sp. NJ-S-72]